MISTPVQGARERRGARKEPKRQRSCEDRCQPSRIHTAEPPQSGRHVGRRIAARVENRLAESFLRVASLPVPQSGQIDSTGRKLALASVRLTVVT